MLKAIQVAQFEGFGNMTPKSLSEYYRGVGASKGASGIVFNKFVSEIKDINDNSVPARSYAYAKGNGVNNVKGNYLYIAGNNNMLYSVPDGITYGIEKQYILPVVGFANPAIIGDPKGRLLAAGDGYIIKQDSTVYDYITGTVSVINGNASVIGVGTTFDASMVGKKIRIGNDSVVYTVQTIVNATNITLSTNYTGTTASGLSYIIYRSWTESWLSFGGSINSAAMPVETYESSVLFGRLNNIITLDTNSDTMTSDSSPSFSMPSGYTNKAISANRAGILMWFDAFDGSTLVLWDNQSIRSIAPWIKMKDPIKAICKYSSGWIVMTSRSVYYTDGYSLTLLISTWLDSENFPLNIKSAEAVNNYVYFTLQANASTKQRDGLYRLDIKTGLVEYYGTSDGTQIYTSFGQVYNVPSSNYIVFGDYTKHYIVSGDLADTNRVFSYITNPVAKGSTKKSAKKVVVPITISQTFTSNGFVEGFKIECYINPMKRQNRFLTSVESQLLTKKVIRVYKNFISYNSYKLNDSIEFLSGVNAGQIRYITKIDDFGGSTYDITLDSDLPYYANGGDQVEYSPFRFIGSYTLNQTQATDFKNLIFTVKEDLVGVGFMIRFVLSGMRVPIEILPFMFAYEDVGSL